MEKVLYGNLADAPGMPPVEVEKEEDAPLTDEQFEQALPKPSGFKILISLPKVDDTYEGGVIKKIKTAIQNEQVTSVVALVLEVGPDAYPKDRFPSGPWCKAGDYVLVGPYKGTRFILNGAEFRIINDDSIEGVVANPAGYRRI